MKYVKMLGLAAVAAAALMAFVGASTASATEVYGNGVTLGEGATLDFSIKSGTSANLVDTEGETLDTCTSGTVKGKITSPGSSTTTTVGDVETADLTWGGCTFPTKTLKGGGLEIHVIENGPNGTLTTTAANGTFEVTINTIFFGSCIYGVTGGSDLGVLTGGVVPAQFHANAVAEKFTGSNLACPATSKWTATYVATSPEELEVKVS